MCVTQDLLVKCDQLRAEMSQLLLSFLQHPKRRKGQRDGSVGEVFAVYAL